MIKKLLSLSLAIPLFFVLAFSAFAQPYENFPASVHIQSQISDGRYSIAELAKLARQNSVRILILSDTLLRRWEYGIWPWQNLIKKTVAEKSVIQVGAKNYLALIAQARKQNPEVIIIPAVEVAPFYYWKGSLFNGQGLSLYHWHKKMLVVGLKNAEDYRRLPVVASYAHLPQRLSDLGKFWPVFLILLGFIVPQIRFKRKSYFSGKRFIGYITPFVLWKYILIGVGLISLFNNLTFSVSPYDIYHGEKGIGPYQYLIDYVNKKGGLVFWLHPEANYTRIIRDVKVLTYSYKDDLLRVKDYQGFSGIYNDNITITNPGDLWDRILIEYCHNKRKSPVWILGEVGFDGISKKNLTAIQTIFLLPKLTQDNILRALRQGKMYAQLNQQKNDFSLVRFVVTGRPRDRVGFMGDDIKIRGSPRIEIKLRNPSHFGEEITIKLIREGKIIQEIKASGPGILWNFSDADCPRGGKTFYRLELESNICQVLSNPIFVTAQ